jgi:hypothetical protein
METKATQPQALTSATLPPPGQAVSPPQQHALPGLPGHDCDQPCVAGETLLTAMLSPAGCDTERLSCSCPPWADAGRGASTINAAARSSSASQRK